MNGVDMSIQNGNQQYLTTGTILLASSNIEEIKRYLCDELKILIKCYLTREKKKHIK